MTASMFRAILYSQWKWSRLVIVLGTLAGFALPLLSLQGAASADRGALQAQDLLRASQSWGSLYPLLAAAMGLLVAITTWAADHRGRHVHALTLPVRRSRYVLLRFAAGITLLAVPILAVFVGAVLAVATATIPPGLQTYAVALAIRFALAVGVAYAIFFAISAGTARTAGIILGTIAAVVVAHIVASMVNLDFDVLGILQNVMLHGTGPLVVFVGRWMLVDV